MADLTPTPDNPGLHVSKHSVYAPANGSYACRCGETQQAKGDESVRDLVTGWTDHRAACTGRKGQ
ncbi:hypothetical protein WKI65_07075 [Streptomyces sp. MS1.AVA.3]|uniref:hypothetical protein n=1 Tax=Streptomyces decoyicus TaxID=249567 RepID=UPI0030C4E333